jgi:hypothetical protein
VGFLPEEDVTCLRAFFMRMCGIKNHLVREVQCNNNVYMHLSTVTKIIAEFMEI